jgi:hypothetical protein
MIQVNCRNCQKQFTTSEKTRLFCNQSCSAKFNNIVRSKKPCKKCLNCLKILSSNKKIYCDNICQHSAQRKNKIEKGFDKCSSRFMRDYLIDKHGAECMKCQWKQINNTTGKIPIEMNHIDGNSENNDLDNLELLCPNCHSLTSNYRALNKGNGRHKRRERYNAGKSY